MKPPGVDAESKIPRCASSGVTTSEKRPLVHRQIRVQILGACACYAALPHHWRNTTHAVRGMVHKEHRRLAVARNLKEPSSGELGRRISTMWEL